MAFTAEQLKLLKQFQNRVGGSGVFRIEADGSISIGRHKNFTNVNDALDYMSTSGMKSFTSIRHGTPVSDLPKIGPQYYAGIEELLLERIVATAPDKLKDKVRGMSIDRYSFAVRPGGAKALFDELKTDKGIRGFIRPSDDGNVVLRFYDSRGDEFATDTLRQLLGNVMGVGGKAGATKISDADIGRFLFDQLGLDQIPGQFFKRANQMVNIEELGVSLGRRINVELFNPTTVRDSRNGNPLSPMARKYGFEGQSLVNPHLLMDQARVLEARANELARTLQLGEQDPAVIGMRNNIKQIRKVAREGGSFETLRAFDLSDPQTGRSILGMVKGNAAVPALRDWARAMRGHGFSKEQARNIDIYTSSQNLKDELVFKDIGAKRSYLSTRMNAPSGVVTEDMQSLLAYGDSLFNPRTMNEYTERIITEAQERFVATGELPAGYRASLEATLARSHPREGQTILALYEEQERARRILSQAGTGEPTGDFLREVLRGIRSQAFRPESARHPGDPSRIVPYALRAEVYNYQFADTFFDDELHAGELAYRKRYGWIMHEEDIARLHFAHGGFDLDDAIAQHLRWDKKTNQFVMVGIRSPMSYGESAVLRFDPTKNIGFMEEILKHDQNYASTVEGWARLEDEAMRANRNIYDLYTQLQYNPGSRRVLERIQAAESAIARHRQAQSAALGLARELAPEIEDAYGTFERLNEDFTVRRSTAYIPFEDWSKRLFGVEDVEVSKRLARERFMAPLSEVTARDYDTIMEYMARMREPALMQSMMQTVMANERNIGVLGRYFDTQMIADSVRQQLEDLGLEQLIPYTDPEEIIDIMVSGKGENIAIDDVGVRMRAMIQGLAEAATKGVKFDRMLLDERFKSQRAMFQEAIKELNPDFDIERDWNSLFLDLEDPDQARYAIYSLAREDADMIRENILENERGLIRDNIIPRSIRDRYFYLAAEEQANEMAAVIEASLRHFNREESGFIGNRDWMSRIRLMLESEDDLARAKTKNILANYMTRFFDEQGRFTDEGVETVGSFIKQYGASNELIGFFDKGGLASIYDYVTNEFRRRAGNLGDTVLEAPSLARYLNAIEEEEIPEPIMRVARAAGGRKARMADEAYGAADAVIGDPDRAARFGGKFFESFSGDGIRRLWEIKTFKRGALAAAGLTAFSAIYQKFRDIAPEEVGGPPLLPGGSAYEDPVQSYPIPQMAMTPVPNNQGGVTYRVIADGNFDPVNLGEQIKAVVGDAFVTSNYYNSQNGMIPRPRFNQPRDIEEMFGQV